ncbi:MAG: hypothetical protein HYX24_04555 [Candidatus Aenigmarchaeota archaeon]|nr:hypothetical protein [Candidatus Aenigmarchaeota archaeon]
MTEISYIPSPQARYKKIAALPEYLAEAIFGFLFSEERGLYLRGGSACEFYFPEHLKRGTSDLDLAAKRRITKEEFRAEFQQLADTASGMGFGHEFRETGWNYILTIKGIQLGDSENEKADVGVNVPNMGKAYFERMGRRLRREFAHARHMEYALNSGYSVNVRLMSPEDIIAFKHYRLMKFFEGNRGLIYVPPPSYEEWLEEIWKMREELHKAEKKRFESEGKDAEFRRFKTFLRSACDLYDAMVLWGYASIDKKYLSKTWRDHIGRDWESEELFLRTMEAWNPAAGQMIDVIAAELEGELGDLMRSVAKQRDTVQMAEMGGDFGEIWHSFKKKREKEKQQWKVSVDPESDS